MLKLLRRGAIENPWFYRLIMGGLAAAFVVGMGWWGYASQTAGTVARVDDERIRIDEFRRSYRQTERMYREMFKDQFTEELAKQLNLKQVVLDSLVERRLWLKSGHEMGLLVTDNELLESIRRYPAFSRDGGFDPEIYRRVLRANGLTPESFERLERENLLIQKTKEVIQNGIALIPGEENLAPAPGEPKQLPKNLLNEKRSKALQAHIAALKRRAKIEIHPEAL